MRPAGLNGTTLCSSSHHQVFFGAMRGVRARHGLWLLFVNVAVSRGRARRPFGWVSVPDVAQRARCLPGRTAMRRAHRVHELR